MSMSSVVLALPGLKWWSRLADTATPFSDDSGGGHTLAWGTGVTGNVTGGTADGNKAMTAGTAESTLASATWMDTTGSWWAAVLVKTSATGTERMALSRSTSTTTFEWAIGVGSGNKAIVRCAKSGTSNLAGGTTTLTDGAWHLIVGTYDGANIRCYVDGALEGTSTSFTGALLTGHVLRLGGMGGVRLWTSGDGLDEAMFGGGSGTTSFLSATDVTNLWNAVQSSGGLTGTATEAVTVSATTVGNLGRSTTGTKTLSVSGAAAATLGLRGLASETVTVTPTAGGVRGKVATVAAALTIAATAGGVVIHGGSGNAGPTLTVSTASVANLGLRGAATPNLTLAPTAAGAHGKAGSVATTLGIATTADGVLTSLPHTHLSWDSGLGITFSSGGCTFEPAYVAPPATLGERVIVAQAIDSVAQNGTSFTPAVREQENDYLFHRVVVGGKDVTYFRGVQTPLPTYGLVSPLRYGSGQITFPQIHAAYERPGHGDISWLKKFAVVRVQRVNADGTIAATDYKGFISDFEHQGRTMTCTLGGEVTGLAAMVDRPVPIFPDIRDVGTMVQQTIRGSLRVPTANMPTTGINLLNFGGMSTLDFLTETLAKSTEKDGDQWTVMPNSAGSYRMFQKDTTTVRASVYIDGFRVSEDLRRDFTEEPNRVFAQGIGPDGLRNRFAVYPGLAQAGDITFPGTLSPGDSGDEVTQLMWRLYTMGYIDGKPGFETWTTASDDPVTEAVKDLQDDAGLAQTGVVNAATWRALFNPDVTGYSLIHSRIVPAAQRSYTKYFLTDATGNVIGPNPNADRSKPWVDVTVDMGPGFTRRQIKKWARKELADDTISNWVGTVTVNMGGVIDGTHNPGDPLTSADVLDARAVKPGDNLWLPNWDGGTLVHVSGVNVSNTSVEFAVDTRARDTMKVWEVIARNRQSRMNPSRQWIAQNRRSGLRDDTGAFYDGATFGKIPKTRCAANTWTVIPTPAGRSGILQTIDIQTTDSQAKFGLWISGKQFDDMSDWLDRKVGDPFDIDGVTFGVPYSEHVQRNQKDWVDNKGLVDIWGDEHQPGGYWPRQHTNAAGTVTDAPITGQFRFKAGAPYLCQGAPVLWIAVRPDRDCWVEGGRVLELLLDDAAG